MNRDQIGEIKDTLIGVLKKYGVKRAALFGSIVRGEATKDSDIDLLIEFEGKKSIRPSRTIKKRDGCYYL